MENEYKLLIYLKTGEILESNSNKIKEFGDKLVAAHRDDGGTDVIVPIENIKYAVFTKMEGDLANGVD